MSSKRSITIALIVAVLLLAVGSFALGAPAAQDIIVPGGPRTDMSTLYRNFGTYQAPVVSLAPWDADTGGALTIDVVHHETHEGEMWHAEYTAASVADKGITDVLFRVTTLGQAHTTFDVLAGGQVTVSLYESPTVAAVGTGVTAYNMNRTITTTAATLVNHTPTITTTGAIALVNGRLLPGGTSVNTRVGGGVRQGTEWILAPGKTYLLRTTNTSGAAVGINTVVEWYEEPD